MTVRIGLIGSGFVANFYMQGLRDVCGHEVRVVASPHRDRAQQFAERHAHAAQVGLAAVLEQLADQQPLGRAGGHVADQLGQRLAVRGDTV